MDSFLYKFKIYVELEEYSKALLTLDVISSEILDFSLAEVEFIKKLQISMVKYYSKSLSNLDKITNDKHIEEQNKEYKFILKSYSKVINSEVTEKFEQFISIINVIILKIQEEMKDFKVLITLLHIRAYLFSFLFEFVETKPKYLELALINYLNAIKLSMGHLSKIDLIKLELLYSYMIMINSQMKDKYRSIVLCIEVIKEMEKLTEELNEDQMKMMMKFKIYLENNVDDYNKTVKEYFPKLREIYYR